MNRNSGSIVEHSGAGAIQGFMAQVYGWMTVGLVLTALVAWYAVANPYIIYTIVTTPVLFWGIIIAQFAAVIGMSWLLNRISAGVATMLFMLYSALTGLTMSVILIQYTGASIASTFFVTAGMFGAMTVYGYTTKRDLTRMGSLMFMGLIGIVIASLVNLWLQSPAMMWVITYIGVIVFVGLTAYDTQKLKAMGEELTEDDPENFRKYSIYGALSLYLDFINLFIMLLRILGDRR